MPLTCLYPAYSDKNHAAPYKKLRGQRDIKSYGLYGLSALSLTLTLAVVNASGVPSYKSCYKIDSNKGSTFSKKFQKKYQCTAHACNSDSSVQSHARAAPPMPDSTPDRNARCTLLTFLEPQAPRAEIDMPGVPSRAATRERCSITISKIITRARLQCVCLCRADWMS